MELEYPRFYYETVASTGIDPVVCGPFGEGLPVTVGPEGCTETGSADRPAQLAAKALAKSSGSATTTPRKRAARKATAPASKGSGSNESDAVAIPITKATKRTNARVPTQGSASSGAARTARGTAKVASSE